MAPSSDVAGLEAGHRVLDVGCGLVFVETPWEDKSAASLSFFQEVVERIRADGWMPLGLHLLMGDDAEVKFANVRRNLEKKRLHVVQAVMTRDK